MRSSSVVMIAVVLGVLALVGGGDARAAGKSPGAPRKLALLVGINDYSNPKTMAPRPNVRPWKDDLPWPRLGGTHNDVTQMAALLERDWGFAHQDIKALLDATSEKVVAAFREHLIQQAMPGDLVVFYFSGHGMQVADNPGHFGNLDPGDEADGLDEALVTADSRDEADYVHCIRDDLLGNLIGQVAAKNVVVILDTCHSGTATRAPGRVRGAGYRGDPSWVPALPPAAGSTSRGVASSSGYGEGEMVTSPGRVLLSAAASQEFAQETADGQNGVFTRALLRALSEAASSRHYSYRQLMDVTRPLVAEQSVQRPQLEGEKDSLVFGESTLPPNLLLRATNVPSEPGPVTLNRGSLDGMSAGSRVAAYPASVTDPATTTVKPLCEGEIVSVEPFTCSVTVAGSWSDLDLAALRAAWWWEKKHRFGADRLAVRSEVPETGASGSAVRKALDALPFVTADRPTKGGGEGWDVLVRPAAEARGAQLQVVAPGGRALAALDPAEPGFASQLAEALRREYVRRRILALAEEGRVAPASGEVRIRILTEGEGGVKVEPRTNGDEYALPKDARFWIEVVNTTKWSYYVSVFDVFGHSDAKEGAVRLVYPREHAGPSEGWVKAGATVLLPTDPGMAYFAAEPFGTDTILAVATRGAFADDFRVLLQRLGGRGRGAAAPRLRSALAQAFGDLLAVDPLRSRDGAAGTIESPSQHDPEWLSRSVQLTVAPR